MGIAEQLSGAMGTSDLGWKEESTKPVEYVAAMSGVTNLGSEIFRSKGYDRAAIHRAVLLLAKRATQTGFKRRLPMSDKQARALSRAALVEITYPHCRLCTGARVSIIDDLKVTCPTCNGHGVHHYGDKERARLCGIQPSKWALWESRYELVLSIARGHDCAPMLAQVRLGDK